MSSSFSNPSSVQTFRSSGGATVCPIILNGQEQADDWNGPVSTIYNPVDHATVVGECHMAEMTHLPLIERKARQAFEHCRQLSIAQRVQILNRLAQLIDRHTEPLAQLITQEAGKPIQLSRLETQRAVDTCRAYAVETERITGQLLTVDGRQARICRFPLGPVLAITPFNFPLNLVIHKLAPAIATGCSITVKPAPQTPLTALYLGRLAAEAGYDGISVVPTSNDVAKQLVRSDAFAKLSFTGSAAVGWYLKGISGQKSLTLELGGNAAVIIDAFTEPVEHLAERVAFGAFAYSGQICIAVQRIFVRDALRERFQSALVAATRTMRVGDPMRADTEVGPMISIDAVQHTRNLIKEALKQGANVVYGGNTYNALTMNPTLLDRTTPDMAVNAEEIFGPVATINTYQDFNDVLAQVNQSRYGIHAGLYTDRPEHIEASYHTLEVGGLLINDIPSYRSDRLPYGGVKASGLGCEGVLAGIHEYTHPKTLLIKPASAPSLPPEG